MAICFSVAWCYFILVIFSPLSTGITSLGEERAYLCAFRTFVRFALVWFCLFPLLLGVWEGLRLVIVALPGHFSYLLFINKEIIKFSVVCFSVMGMGRETTYIFNGSKPFYLVYLLLFYFTHLYIYIYIILVRLFFSSISKP